MLTEEHMTSGLALAHFEGDDGVDATNVSRLPLARSSPSPAIRLDRIAEHNLLWGRISPHAPICFTRGLLDQLSAIQSSIIHEAQRARSGDAGRGVGYVVLSSDIPDVFNLGGDIRFFIDCIRHGDRQRLQAYGKQCIDIVYANVTSQGFPYITIALVEGAALGGGFEAALSAKVLIAEEGALFGFPEVTFNLFPGMGAYSLLRQRVSSAEARRIIESGRLYTADELHRMGVVDILAGPGEGPSAVIRYTRQTTRRQRGVSALHRAINATSPIDYHELMRVLDVWIDTAMSLDARDLKCMEYLVRNQARRFGAERNPG